MNKTKGTLKEYCNWKKSIGCEGCIYNIKLFNIWDCQDASKIFDFKFKCQFNNKLITPEDGKIGVGCKGKLE